MDGVADVDGNGCYLIPARRTADLWESAASLYNAYGRVFSIPILPASRCRNLQLYLAIVLQFLLQPNGLMISLTACEAFSAFYRVKFEVRSLKCPSSMAYALRLPWTAIEI